MHHYWIILISAFFLEVLFGYPVWLYNLIRHPVVWMKAGITFLEKKLNRPQWPDTMRGFMGLLTMAVLLGITYGITKQISLRANIVVEVICIASLLATRNLYDHIHDVYAAITTQGIGSAREKVSRVFSRDVNNLDEAGVCRTAIENLAESFSDGVVAPLFWAIFLGLPGIACYKMINTADSIIGHKDERYHSFGWVAARLDDLANWIPARVSGLLIALVSLSVDAVVCMASYAGHATSPNAGWPKSSMAGALGVQLSGIDFYDGTTQTVITIGKGTPDITPEHLQKALNIYLNVCTLIWFMLVLALLIK